MAVANRSARLRRLAAKLTEEFGLPWGHRAIEPYYDETRRDWTFRWQDGPTIEQVRRAARKAQPEAVEGLNYRRRLSAEAHALGALRITLAAEPENDDFQGPYVSPSRIEEHFAQTRNPAPQAGREATMVANLLKASKDHGRNYWDESERACNYVMEKGLAKALDGVDLTPLELLTARYAQGAAERAWRRRLVPLTPLEAFSAAQADTKASPEAVAAALALVPELHAAIDTAAAALQARVKDSEPES